MIEEIVKHAIAKATNNDKDASQFLSDIYETIHFWDDLIDKDKLITDQHINDCFMKLLFLLPTNVFYKRHFDYLNPILNMAMINWQAATKMERNPVTTNDFVIAFIIRSQYVDLLSACAYLTHDHKTAIDLIIEFRRLVHCEGLENYLIALDQERNA